MEKKNNATPNIEELKEKYGKLYVVTVALAEDDDTTREEEYYFSKPTAISYDRFVKTAATSTTKASRAFVLDAIIEEQRQQLIDDLEEYPALVLSVGEKLMYLMGMSKETTLKKI